MENYCKLCERRISNWTIVAGKTKEVIVHGEKELVHKSCLIDFKLRYGEEYGHDDGV